MLLAAILLFGWRGLAFASDEASAITPEPKPPVVEDKWRAVWLSSIAVHGAATAFDAYSSYHRGPYEANTLLADPNGQFGNKAVFVKTGIFAGSTALQYVFVSWASHHDSHLARALTKTFTFVNFGAGATYFAIGAHNFGVVSAAKH